MLATFRQKQLNVIFTNFTNSFKINKLAKSYKTILSKTYSDEFVIF